MLEIKRKYILNKTKKRVAVQLDIKTFEKIESLMEDYVLKRKIKENQEADRLKVAEAKAYYGRLKRPTVESSLSKEFFERSDFVTSTRSGKNRKVCI